MEEREVEFGAVLDALLGRGSMPEGADAALVERAQQFVAAGRTVGEQPAPSRRALRRADKIFRSAARERKQSAGLDLLRLVFDSWLEPAPALRYEGGERPRFLRYAGAFTVELQILDVSGRVQLRGQVTPPDAATEARLQIGSRTRRAKIDTAGLFSFERLARGTVALRIGEMQIEGLPL